MPRLMTAMVLVALAACGDAGAPATTGAPTSAAPAPTTATLPPPTTTLPPPTTTTTTLPPATSTAPPTTSTSPPPTTAPVGEIVVAPNAPLAGVTLGTEAEEAVTALTAELGPPTADTGWAEGCPLDGLGANERFVEWGGLSAQFRLDDAGTGRFTVWTYNAGFGEPPLPLALPGGVSMSDPIDAVAAALGVPVEFDDVFQVFWVAVDGLVFWSDPAAGGDQLTIAGVPYVPTCE